MEIKIFRYNNKLIYKSDIIKAFSAVDFCCFFEEEGIVAVHFDIDKLKRKRVMEVASDVGVVPLSITRGKFLNLLKIMTTDSIKITNVEFIDPLEKEDQNELNSLLVEKSKEIYDFVYDVLGRYETFIKHIDWYDSGSLSNKITLFDSGILFSNKNIDLKKHKYLNALAST